jgi:RNA polymerase sigma-70 factor, ECF subfamily
MAGQAILGETLLKQAIATATEAPAKTVEDLAAEHALMVFRIAYSILRNHHDAEDASQECFLRVVRFQKRLPRVRNAKTWLARIAWTTALDRRSRRSAFPGNQEVLEAEEDALAQFPDASPGQDESLGSMQMQQLLEKLIAGLPEELRQPLELSTVHELKSAEIAEVMEIPEGSVRTRLLRARRLLKEKLSILLEVKKHG